MQSFSFQYKRSLSPLSVLGWSPLSTRGVVLLFVDVASLPYQKRSRSPLSVVRECLSSSRISLFWWPDPWAAKTVPWSVFSLHGFH
jgi:hypothetical protein